MATAQQLIIAMSATGGAQVAREFATVSNGIDQLNQKLENIGRNTNFIASVVRVALVRMATDIVENIGQASIGVGVAFNVMAEQANIAFTQILGSAEKATKFFADLRQVAIESPLNLEQVRTAGQQLLAMGVSAEKVIPIMRMLTDAASALGGNMGDRIFHLSLALGQMANSATVKAQDMNQFIQAGIPAWDNLAKAIGKTVAETRHLSETGKIPGIVAANAQLDYLEKNFAGIAEKMGKSLGGLAATLREDILPQAIGAMIKPATDRLRDFLETVVTEGQGTFIQEKFKNIAKSFDDFLNYIQGFFAQIDAISKEHGMGALDATLATISMRINELAGGNASKAFDQITQGIGNAASALGQFKDTQLIPAAKALFDLAKTLADTAINGRSFADAIGPAGSVLDAMRSALDGVLSTLNSHKEILAGVVTGFLALQGLQVVVPVMINLAAAFEAIFAAFAVGGSAAGFSALLTFLAPAGPLAVGMAAIAVASGVLAAAWIGDWGNIREKTSVVIEEITSAMDRFQSRISTFGTDLNTVLAPLGPASGGRAGTAEYREQIGASILEGINTFDTSAASNALASKMSEILHNAGAINKNTDFLGEAFGASFSALGESMDRLNQMVEPLNKIDGFFSSIGKNIREAFSFFLSSQFDTVGAKIDTVVNATGTLGREIQLLSKLLFGDTLGAEFDKAGRKAEEAADKTRKFKNVMDEVKDIFDTAKERGDAAFKDQLEIMQNENRRIQGLLDAERRKAAMEAAKNVRLDTPDTGPPPEERGKHVAESAIQGFMRELQSNTANFKAQFGELAAKAASSFSEAFATNTGGAGASAARAMDTFIDKMRESGIENWRELGDELAGKFHDALLTRLDSAKTAALEKLAELDELLQRANKLSVENFADAFNQGIGKASLGTAGANLMKDLEEGLAKGGRAVIEKAADAAQQIINTFTKLDPAQAATWASTLAQNIAGYIENGTEEAKKNLTDFLRWLNTEAPLIVAQAKADAAINKALQDTELSMNKAKSDAGERISDLTEDFTRRINIRNTQEQINELEKQEIRTIQDARDADLERFKNMQEMEKMRRGWAREDDDRALSRSDASLDRAQSRAEQLRQFFRSQHGTPSALSISGSAGQIDEMKRQWAIEDQRIEAKNKREDARVQAKRQEMLRDREVDQEAEHTLAQKKQYWENWIQDIRLQFIRHRVEYQDALDRENIEKQAGRINRELGERIASMQTNLDALIAGEQGKVDEMRVNMERANLFTWENLINGTAMGAQNAQIMYEYIKAATQMKGGDIVSPTLPSQGASFYNGSSAASGGGGAATSTGVGIGIKGGSQGVPGKGNPTINQVINNNGFVVGQNGMAQFAKIAQDEMIDQMRVLNFTGGP